MATTSLWRVHGFLGKVVVYVEDPDKTVNPKFFERPDLTEHQRQGLADVIEYAVNEQKTTKVMADESEKVMQQFVSGVNICPAVARDTMREALRRIRLYSQQTRLLCLNKIETSEQLTSFVDCRKGQRAELERERGRVYNRMKAVKSLEMVKELKSERDKLSAKIKTVRTELTLTIGILKEWEEVRRSVSAQIKRDVQMREADKTNLKKEVPHHKRHQNHAR